MVQVLRNSMAGGKPNLSIKGKVATGKREQGGNQRFFFFGIERRKKKVGMG